MKLPEDIERELLYIWSGQQAGFPKLRGLRGAIERHMADLAAARAQLHALENKCVVSESAYMQQLETDLALKENARRGLALSLENAEADLAAARAVLHSAKQHDSDITFAAPQVWIQVDRAAWQAWQARKGQ